MPLRLNDSEKVFVCELGTFEYDIWKYISVLKFCIEYCYTRNSSAYERSRLWNRGGRVSRERNRHRHNASSQNGIDLNKFNYVQLCNVCSEYKHEKVRYARRSHTFNIQRNKLNVCVFNIQRKNVTNNTRRRDSFLRSQKRYLSGTTVS